MSGVEDLLGLRYLDLDTTDALSGVDIPPREDIMDQSYISIFSRGMSLVLPDRVHVSSVQLHARDHEDFDQYPDALPHGLDFGMSRTAVRALLGEPDDHGDEAQVLILGKKPAWDSFTFGDVKLHVEYDFGAKSILMVSLSKR